MKNLLFVCLSFGLINLNLLAQQEKCGTMENLARLESLNPSLSQQMEDYEHKLQAWTNENQHVKAPTGTIITIPVVVHVVYKTAAQNISDAQILSQIDILNEDFRRLNADAANTPSNFVGVAADCEIEFCLASIDPSGNPTNGIVRKQTTVTSFSTNDDVKRDVDGGDDAWDVTKYFNIWVCNLSGLTLGYAQFPATLNNTYGMVCSYTAFGNMGTAAAPYNKGRTSTHEIGHCFNLRHIWGDANCGNDFVSDTPIHKTANYGANPFTGLGCYTHPKSNTCGTADEMFENYMDYSNDECLNLFTQGQKTRMLAILNNPPMNVLKNSTVCGIATSDRLVSDQKQKLTVYPNPAQSFVSLKTEASIQKAWIEDALGRVVGLFSEDIHGNYTASITSTPSGMYLVKVALSSGKTATQKLIID